MSVSTGALEGSGVPVCRDVNELSHEVQDNQSVGDVLRELAGDIERVPPSL
jgi:hypothetical protein